MCSENVLYYLRKGSYIARYKKAKNMKTRKMEHKHIKEMIKRLYIFLILCRKVMFIIQTKSFEFSVAALYKMYKIFIS